jgi:hypothetical protein
MLRLKADWRFPREPKPAEILINSLLEFRPAPLDIYVLDSEQKAAA